MHLTLRMDVGLEIERTLGSFKRRDDIEYLMIFFCPATNVSSTPNFGEDHSLRKYTSDSAQQD